MGERYWTNDIIDPDEVATFGADCKGGANAFNSYWCSTAGDQAGGPGPGRARTRAKRQAMYSQIQQIVYQQSPFIVIDYSPYRYGVGELGAGLPRHARSATTTCRWRR